MKIEFDMSPDPVATAETDVDRAERAVTRAMRGGARRLKAEWRAQIREAGLGNRLPNTVRSEAYPASGQSINAAAMVWTNAPNIIGAHDAGALIQSADGFYLAIPLEAAGRAGRARMTPAEFKRRRGIRLRFVYRPGRPGLLVADDARLSKRGQALQKRGRRRKKDGILTGAQTVPVFVLVRQVKLQKRTDLIGGAEAIAGAIENQMLFVEGDRG